MTDLLCIHGNSLSGESFRYQQNARQINELFNLHAINLPGHGDSARIDKYTLDRFLEHIDDYIRSIGTTEINIIGHSLGGHLAIDLLSRDLDYKVSKLLIFGTPPLKLPLDMSAFHAHPAMAQAYAGALTDTAIKALAVAFGSADFAEIIRQADPLARVGIGTDLAGGNTLDEVALLEGFKGQLAVVHGAEDPLVNLDYIKVLNLDLWQDQVHVISGAGHSPQYEQPEQFNKLIMKFMS